MRHKGYLLSCALYINIINNSTVVVRGVCTIRWNRIILLMSAQSVSLYSTSYTYVTIIIHKRQSTISFLSYVTLAAYCDINAVGT